MADGNKNEKWVQNGQRVPVVHPVHPTKLCGPASQSHEIVVAFGQLTGIIPVVAGAGRMMWMTGSLV